MKTRAEIEKVLKRLRDGPPDAGIVFKALDSYSSEEIDLAALDVLCSSAFSDQHLHAFISTLGCTSLYRCLVTYLNMGRSCTGLIASGARAMAKLSTYTLMRGQEMHERHEWIQTAVKLLYVAISLDDPFYVEVTRHAFLVIGNVASEADADKTEVIEGFRKHVLIALTYNQGSSSDPPDKNAGMYMAACYAIDRTTSIHKFKQAFLTPEFRHDLVPKLLKVLKYHGHYGKAPELMAFAFRFIGNSAYAGKELTYPTYVYHGVVDAASLILESKSERAAFEGMRTLYLTTDFVGVRLPRRDAMIARITGVLAKAILMRPAVSDLAILCALRIVRKKEYARDVDAALCFSSVQVVSKERSLNSSMDAVRLIRNLARTRHLRSKLVEAGACVVLARRLTGPGLASWAWSMYGAVCCTAIETLAQDAATKDALGDSGACEQVLLFLRGVQLHLQDNCGTISATAWRAANALAEGHGANQARLRAAGARDLFRTFGVNANFGHHKLPSLRAWLHPASNEPMADSVSALEQRCKRAERDLEEERNSRAAERTKWGIQECVVCQENAADVRLLPCQCEVVCSSCCEKLDKSACPACREKIARTEPVPTLANLRDRMRSLLDVLEPPRQRRRTSDH